MHELLQVSSGYVHQQEHFQPKCEEHQMDSSDQMV